MPDSRSLDDETEKVIQVPDNIDSKTLALVDEVCKVFPVEVYKLIPRVDYGNDEDQEDLEFKATMFFDSTVGPYNAELSRIILSNNSTLLSTIQSISQTAVNNDDFAVIVYLYQRIRVIAQEAVAR